MSVPPRPAMTRDLLELLRTRYGLDWVGNPVELPSSVNLNVLLSTPDGGHVARVYRSWTSPARLDAIQAARAALVAAGLPFARTVPTRDGANGVTLDGLCVEVECHMPGDNMEISRTLPLAMPVLARIHDVLRGVPGTAFGRVAPSPNHVDSDCASEWTTRGTDAIRAMHPTGAELRAADTADSLARELAESEGEIVDDLPRQLVHGDFWDNNVLFRGAEIVVILDLDFMGDRPRIDDLALTLYYTNSTLGPDYESVDRIDRLRALIDAYDDGLDQSLSSTERAALPLALARTVLCFVGMIASMHDDGARSALIRAIDADLEWSLAVVNHAHRWQSLLA
jgi:Ser/Thr protein kinase RdoA (MazF antagonist)